MMVAVKVSALHWRRLPVREVRWLDERLRDRCGRERSEITLPSYRRGRKPPNFGKTYPAEPLTADEVQAILDVCEPTATGRRNRGLFVLLWRSGVRISEALALEPRDLNPEAFTVHVRHGKGNKARVIGMDREAWLLLAPWLQERHRYPAGPVFCVLSGPSAGLAIGSPYVRTALKRYGERAGIQKRVHPHGLRHSLACQLSRGGMPIHVVSRQLGHSNLGTTATYLAGIANTEVVEAVADWEWPA